jgi:hypothetical protein
MENHIQYFAICKFLNDRNFSLNKTILINDEGLTERFEYWSNDDEETYLIEVLCTNDAFMFKLV